MRLRKPLDGCETKGLLSVDQEWKQFVLQGIMDGSGRQLITFREEEEGSGFSFFHGKVGRGVPTEPCS